MIDLQIEPGIYVIAVSGGVDSMALLHMLVNHQKNAPDLRLIVAHFDHGIRPDAAQDRQFVQKVATRYGLPFVYDQGELGANVGEATARQARYAFLHQVRKASGAAAIVTAHHQDDVLETALINLLRGTGWRGLASLRSGRTIKRPLLQVPKSKIIAYAKKHTLTWREDSTNKEMRYFRNRIRQKVLPLLQTHQKQELLQQIRKMHELRDSLEHELADYFELQPNPYELNRRQFIMLPHALAREVMVAWFKRHNIQDISAAKLERLVAAAKTLAPKRKTDVDKNHILAVSLDRLALINRER